MARNCSDLPVISPSLIKCTSQAMLRGESNADHSNDSSVIKKVQLSFRTKRKATKKKAATAPVKDYTNSLNHSHFIAPVISPEHKKAAKGVMPANTRANSNWAIKNFKE